LTGGEDTSPDVFEVKAWTPTPSAAISKKKKRSSIQRYIMERGLEGGKETGENTKNYVWEGPRNERRKMPQKVANKSGSRQKASKTGGHRKQNTERTKTKPISAKGVS